MVFRNLVRFWRKENAAVAFETLILIPILTWAFISSFIFFDAYRTYNSSIKATYAIADVLSRRDTTVYPTDIEGLSSLFTEMVRNTGSVRLRVTQIFFNVAGNYEVEWSHATGGAARLFDINLEDLVDRLPVMAEGERLILVETFIPFRPVYDVGLEPITFENFTFTRPRYAPCVPFDDLNPNTTNPQCGPPDTA